jgi:hypothetical protein
MLIHEPKSEKCQYCDKLFFQKGNRLEHETDFCHKNPARWDCPKCNQSFSSAKKEIHLQRGCKSVQERIDDNTCGTCKVYFHCQTLLKNHNEKKSDCFAPSDEKLKKEKEKLARLTCKKCGMFCFTMGNLIAHEKNKKPCVGQID